MALFPMVNPAKKKLAEGGLVLCMGIRQARTVDILMVAAQCGFDSFYVDMEHSPVSHETAAALCAGSLGLGLTPVVRIAGQNGHEATRMLDGGALGLILPHVNNADQARAIVDACRHPPIGHRSVAGSGPALGYERMPAGEINDAANERTLLILMIETPQAVEQADAIAAVPGFDVLLIGSGDLSTEYGIPGQGSHAKMRAAQDKVAAACRKHNKVYGIAGLSTDFAFQAELIAKGARFVMTGSEVNYFASAARAEADRFRALPLEKP